MDRGREGMLIKLLPTGPGGCQSTVAGERSGAMEIEEVLTFSFCRPLLWLRVLRLLIDEVE